MKLRERLIEELRTIRESLPSGVDLAIHVHEWAIAHAESAWHEYLEWDDAKCGVAWRLQQIRNFVVTVREEPVPGSDTEEKFHTFVSVPVEDPKDGRRRSTEFTRDVIDDAEQRRQLIVRLLNNAYGQLRYHPELEELDPARNYLLKQIDKYSKEN